MPETFQPPPPPNPRPAVHYSRPTNSGDTVFVACKLPNGIVLRVFAWQKYAEPSRDGTINREAMRAVPIAGQQFIVKGPWVATGGQAYNLNNGAVGELLNAGYAITEGCPKELWEKWLEQNQESALVRNGVIRANKDRNDLIKELRTNYAQVLSGLEPLDKANPGARMGGIDRRLKFGIIETNDGPG